MIPRERQRAAVPTTTRTLTCHTKLTNPAELPDTKRLIPLTKGKSSVWPGHASGWQRAPRSRVSPGAAHARRAEAPASASVGSPHATCPHARVLAAASFRVLRHSSDPPQLPGKLGGAGASVPQSFHECGGHRVPDTQQEKCHSAPTSAHWQMAFQGKRTELRNAPREDRTSP